MTKRGIDIINNLRRKWIGYQLLADAILAFAIALILGKGLWHWVFYVGYIFFPYVLGVLPVFILSFGIITLIRRPWQLKAYQVTTFLNQTYPELEESTELLLKDDKELNLLQQLQLSRVEAALTHIPSLPKQFLKRVKKALLYLAAAIIIMMLTPPAKTPEVTGTFPFPPPLPVKEKILPQIESAHITITPPTYTGKPKREQQNFGILAEESSTVNWQIKTNIALKRLSLLFNDKERIALKSYSDGTVWAMQKTINKPGFYQVDADGKLSDLYQIETVKDNAPVISIKAPKQYTYIDAGEAPRVSLLSNVSDDYGISNAMIYATVAKGSGESVKFKEYKIDFGESFAGHKTHYTLKHLFDLPKLDMQPGDELYFYVEALDNHQQKTRTDVYTVTLQDTAALLSMNGLMNNGDVKPEYFRSQRQIIIDTENLLKQKDTLSKEAFNTACNNIGIDQKLLRLRYGRFLGEEDESDVGGMGDNDDLAKIENFNNAEMIKDAMTDKHDNAEDATFFEPGIKAQLKATLTEMWNAELRLRLFKPQEALAFEYKALRLLKNLQQKSRAYVAKTTYNTPALKPEKRLSGELDKVIQPVNKATISAKADQFATLKSAIPILEHIKLSHSYDGNEKRILQLARQQLSLKAAEQPGIYLTAVSALNRILATTKPQLTDINQVERAIEKALPKSVKLPKKASAAPDKGLAQYYYQNLKNQQP